MAKSTTVRRAKVSEETPSKPIHSLPHTSRASGFMPLALKAAKKVSTTNVLVVLLVVAAFLIGVLYTKVQYLENGSAGGSAGTPAAAPSAAGQQAAAPTTAPAGPVNVGDGSYPALGDSNAKVTIVEFADFRCPFCEQYFTQTATQIYNDYIKTGKVKFYFRNYAFLGPASIVAADAAACANDQGKFWAYHDWLYKNQPPETDTSMYNTADLTKAAVNLGMNGTQFENCLNNKTDDKIVTQDLSDGQAAGVTGTPTFFVNGQMLVGAQPYSAFKTLIDQELAKVQ